MPKKKNIKTKVKKKSYSRDSGLAKIETKVEHIHSDITNGNKSMVKVIIGATGTIVAGLISTIVVLLISFN